VHYLRRIEDSGRLCQAPSTVGAGMHLNQSDEGIAPGHERIRSGVPVDRHRLSDPAVSLADITPGVTRR
jgi:hypothetical protein